jgi:dTDP-4-dehydrorhamnose reductase
MPILVIGRTGQLACALAANDSDAHFVGRDRLDLADTDRIAGRLSALCDEFEPQAIVNAAAYTAVDRAEDEPELAFRINADAPGQLAFVASRLAIPFVHVSTDYVFAGDRPGARCEDDPTGPIGVYGQSKLAGEAAVRNAAPSHFIVRTSWVYDAQGQNFLRTMLRLGRERDELRVVDDQRGAPTAAPDLARAILEMLAAARQPGAAQDLFGTYHFSGSGGTTWCGFARAILQRAATLQPDVQWANITPITTAEYPTRARRPANSLLDCGRIARRFGILPRHWEQALDEVMYDWNRIASN